MNLEESKEQFSARIKAGISANKNTYFMFVTNDLAKNYEYADICYREIAANIQHKHTKYILSHFKGCPALPKSVQEEFLNYMINESPYAVSFEEHDIKDIMENRVIVSKTDVPSPLMQGALVHIRQMWEFPHPIINWNLLVQAGMEKNLAWCIAHLIWAEPENKRFCLDGIIEGHRCWSKYVIYPSHILNYLKGEYKEGLPYTQAPSFSGNSTIFHGKSSQGDANIIQPFKAWVQKLLTKKKEGDYVSPFAKSVSPWYDLDELITLAKHQDEIINMCNHLLQNKKVA